MRGQLCICVCNIVSQDILRILGNPGIHRRGGGGGVGGGGGGGGGGGSAIVYMCL